MASPVAEFSPSNIDGSYELHLNQEGALSYAIETGGSYLISPSKLGLEVENATFTSGFEYIGASEPRKIEQTYELAAGKAKLRRDQSLEQVFRFRNKDNRELEIQVRSFHEGFAFRYGIPGPNGVSIRILNDITEFALPAKGSAWMLPYEPIATWSPSYEMEWQNKIKIGTTAPEGMVGWCFPALFQTKDKWIFLTEAGIDGSSFATHLKPTAPKGRYQTALPPENETYGVAPQYADSTLPWASPWKVVLFSDTLAPIVETNVVTHLSPPNAIADTSWIKPGRVSWSWWGDTSSPNDYNRLVPFIDLSADMGWEYSLIDLGWHEMKNGNIEQLARYAADKGVGLILWYNSGGPHNEVHPAGPEDLMHIPEVRRAEMARIQKMGIKGIKVDFMQSDKQYIMQLYLDILKDAADHKLLVDFHGSTLPRGFARTYPNLMTMESIRGTEQYWDPNFAENAHTFHTIYTFTRNVVGSMDYTPVVLSTPAEKMVRKTTNAHELALSVAFESGLQHYCDTVAAYRSLPEYAKDLLRNVPAAWDETRFLGGYPGELSILARRNGETWFVSVLNGTAAKKATTVDFSFLPEGTYELDAIVDGGSQKQTEHINRKVGANESIKIEMLPRGGAAIALKPIKKQ